MWLFKKEAQPFGLSFHSGPSQLCNYKILRRPSNTNNKYIIDISKKNSVFPTAELTFENGTLSCVHAAIEISNTETVFEEIEKKLNSNYKKIDGPLLALYKDSEALGLLGAFGFAALSAVSRQITTNRYWKSADSIQIKLTKTCDIHSIKNIKNYISIEYLLIKEG